MPERPVSVFTTVRYLQVAPAGAVTVSWVEDAVVAAAYAAPKKTILLPGVVLKPLPLIVTMVVPNVPVDPVIGVNELITGCAPDAITMNIEKSASKYFRLIGFLYCIEAFLIIPLC
nr:hypothetical protein [Sediminibacterium goheungense]